MSLATLLTMTSLILSFQIVLLLLIAIILWRTAAIPKQGQQTPTTPQVDMRLGNSPFVLMEREHCATTQFDRPPGYYAPLMFNSALPRVNHQSVASERSSVRAVLGDPESWTRLRVDEEIVHRGAEVSGSTLGTVPMDERRECTTPRPALEE